jgi:hypothetical protein
MGFFADVGPLQVFVAHQVRSELRDLPSTTKRVGSSFILI